VIVFSVMLQIIMQSTANYKCFIY